MQLRSRVALPPSGDLQKPDDHGGLITWNQPELEDHSCLLLVKNGLPQCKPKKRKEPSSGEFFSFFVVYVATIMALIP
ncbi:hypothetical protein DCMF_09650 [Candidatus Formimonas warabiya]|uniref:Uncharacterized protein n=1 Tax=Formimonas warabiya TaxID=1761012 RepID=A0A3G1KS84_FORW1|nr:hypothetical protein DCMF_09650 [Candidatus Formimonas warabiya]